MPILIFCFSDMLHYFSIQIEDQLFGDIRTMVAETFHLTDHTCHIKSDQGASRMFLDVVGNDPSGVMVNLVDQVVFEENTGGYFRTFFFEGFLAEGKHTEQFFQHLFHAVTDHFLDLALL